MFEFTDSEALFDHLPHGCVPVAVELDERARPLQWYVHPERACYILGAEDNGLPRRVIDRCRDVVQIPGDYCLNVAVAGSIVLYDRVSKLGAVAQQVERLPEKQEVAGSIPARPMTPQTLEDVAEAWIVVRGPHTGFVFDRTVIEAMGIPLEDRAPCIGGYLPRERFPVLYEMIGETYGGGPESFRLPDFRGKIIAPSPES